MTARPRAAVKGRGGRQGDNIARTDVSRRADEEGVIGPRDSDAVGEIPARGACGRLDIYLHLGVEVNGTERGVEIIGIPAVAAGGERECQLAGSGYDGHFDRLGMGIGHKRRDAQGVELVLGKRLDHRRPVEKCYLDSSGECCRPECLVAHGQLAHTETVETH